jgi:predicted transcriptional regulator
MSSLSVRLPDSLHDKVRELARRDDVSINQFIATAVAEKASALLTVDYLEQRAGRADPDLFDRVLRRVPDVPPLPGDELPADIPSSPTANPAKGLSPNPTRRRSVRNR